MNLNDMIPHKGIMKVSTVYAFVRVSVSSECPINNRIKKYSVNPFPQC